MCTQYAPMELVSDSILLFYVLIISMTKFVSIFIFIESIRWLPEEELKGLVA